MPVDGSIGLQEYSWEVQMVDPLLVSKRDAARLLSVSLRTVENLIARKQLFARRIGRRVLISRTTLEAFARRGHSGPFAGQDDGRA